MSESYAGKINRKLLKKRRILEAAAGREPADLVLKNATYVNVFSNQLCTADADKYGKCYKRCAHSSGELPGRPEGICQGCFAPWHHHSRDGPS